MKTNKGSALITAVVFSTVILLGIAGALPMLLNSWKNTARTSLQEAAFSLAESAVEEGVWAVNEYLEDANAWRAAGWREGPTYWYKQWTLDGLSTKTGKEFNLDEDRHGIYRAIVEKVSRTRVVVAAQGVVIGGRDVAQGTRIERYIETEFKKPNPNGEGLVSRDTIDFSGGPTFDSYDSRDFPYYYAEGVNSNDEVTVGSVSTDANLLNLGQANILGDVATGASDDGSDPVGGAHVTGDIKWDFEMDFPPTVKPDTTGWSTTIP